MRLNTEHESGSWFALRNRLASFTAHKHAAHCAVCTRIIGKQYSNITNMNVNVNVNMIVAIYICTTPAFIIIIILFEIGGKSQIQSYINFEWVLIYLNVT